MADQLNASVFHSQWKKMGGKISDGQLTFIMQEYHYILLPESKGSKKENESEEVRQVRKQVIMKKGTWENVGITTKWL